MDAVTSILAAVVDISSLPHNGGADAARLQIIVNIIFAITGAVALLMITIAGFRYVVSHGDPNSTAQAKQMILYSLVGLVVTLTAWSIVTFVMGRL